MRKNQTSSSAIGIAIVRAIESERPEGERVCYDPYARRMVSEALYRMVRLFERAGWGERKGPGVMGFLVARERHIDEFLLARLKDGLQQLVILGAGLDMRAQRFEALKRGVKVFEVDHPASQRAKLAKLERVFGERPAHVAYTAIDFNTQTLEERLPAEGYDPALKTLFIWQGVTQYLTPAGVDRTLAFIAGCSAPGSAVIFDYIYTAALDGTIQRGEVRHMNRRRWIFGEPLTFGIAEGAAKEFLEQRGFRDVHDADNVELHDRYFTGVSAARTVAYGYGIVSAVVSGR
jgi:methyltransferase (TIGR00027 family)